MLHRFAFSSAPAPAGPEGLLRVIRTVRNRWRLKLALRGLAIVVGAGALVVLVSTFGMDLLRFTPVAVAVFRVLAYGSLLGLFAWFVVRPLRRTPPDASVALYLEEREPALAGEVLTAVELARGRDRKAAHSRALAERLVEQAMARYASADYGKEIDRRALRRSSGALAGATLTALAVVALNPAFLRHGAPFLLTPWAGRGAASPYSIDVAPGDTVVARGADLEVSAVLRNFGSDRVELAARRGADGEWERWPMLLDDETGEHTVLLFDLDSVTTYFVAAGGVRSPLYRITVADLPHVKRIDLEYHFPAYTGLGPERREDTGDIAALAGTRVVVRVTSSMAVAAGAIVLDGGDTVSLAPMPDGTLEGTITVQRRGSYRIALEAPGGGLVPASPEYVIDVLDDQPPLVTFAKPGRDLSVTSIDEVFIEVEAEDDYGVARLELRYAVNGGPEETIVLHTAQRLERVTAGHTFYLEELSLEPGDIIAYHARATEAGRSGGAQAGTTDIYFLEIRPFDRRYRQADQAGGGGAGGGMAAGELSRRQRDIIAATFKVVRDSARYTAGEYRDHLSTLALAQGRLREEVETLIRRLTSRGVAELDSTFRTVAEALPRAADAMREAEERLGVRTPREALPPEQRALQQLQRAEAAFREREVARGEPGGGGGGAPDANAEELADLFELELDRMRNQYEQVERGRREQADATVDEALEKLRELARRQQQESERMRALARGERDPSGAGGRAQRRLAEEAEELARRLERLSREQSRPDLRESARRIQEAAEAMRRSASGAAGSTALDRLREARRLLERNRSDGLRRDVEEALRQAERLAEQQREMIGDVAGLPDEPAARAERARRLAERKEQMAGEVEDLESRLDRAARDARQEQPDAARKLEGAAGAIRRERLEDKIRYSRGVVEQRSPEYARNLEEQIGSDLEALRGQIEEALGGIGESREDRLERSLDRTRDVANALESLTERARAARGEGDSGAAGRGSAAGRQRQLRREVAERRQELEQLRREFQREGIDASRLGELRERLGRFDNQGPIGDPRALAELEELIVQGLREFEYSVRRELSGGPDRLYLTGSEDVPPEYRKLVEEYYRSLSGRRR